ncbi:MAG: hypothetical protein AB7F19_02280 [Candidatus Babeliales bacterium]
MRYCIIIVLLLVQRTTVLCAMDLNPNAQESIEYHIPNGTTIALQAPYFFTAKTKEEAETLRSRGADYALTGGIHNGTVLHHVCRTAARNKLQTSLLQFYLEHGAAAGAVDARGRTPLHIVGQEVGRTDAEHAIAWATLLYKYGADVTREDDAEQTFMDYGACYQYEPRFGHLEQRIFHASMRACIFADILKPRRHVVSRAVQSCKCHASAYIQTKLPKVITKEYIEQWCPILPGSPGVLNCEVIRSHPKYPFWQRIVAVQDAREFGEGAADLLLCELNPVFSNWHELRVLIAMVLTINKNYFNENFESFNLGKLALIEDDIPLVQFFIQHGIYKIDLIHWARSGTMVKLLARLPKGSVDAQGNNAFHHVAKFGMLTDDDHLHELFSVEGNRLLEQNHEGQTPLDVLAEYSYRYQRHPIKLIEIARLLLLEGADPDRVHDKTKKSAFTVAKEVDNYWQIPATNSLVRLLAAAQAGKWLGHYLKTQLTIQLKKAAIVKEALALITELTHE